MRIGTYAVRSSTGRRRMQNEDAYVVAPPLFAVADGMGGAQAGEIASRLAAAALTERGAGDHGEPAVAALVREANARIFERSLLDPTEAGMGTTATAAIVDEMLGTVAIGHVGDSRAYRLRERALQQVTNDHSLVAELLRSGRLTEAEAESHPHRSVITRALGTEPDVEVDTLTVPLEPGDLYLICSDGLTDMLNDEEILAVLRHAEGDPERSAELLVTAANNAGGIDNITVVLFDIVDGEPVPHAPVVEPDEITLEAVPVQAAAPAAPSAAAAGEATVARWGAGSGSRWPALVVVLAGVLAAAIVVVWSLVR